MSLCVLTPIKDHVAGPHHVSMVALACEFGSSMHHRTTWLSSHLAEARNVLLVEALKTNADRILFADDDIAFTVDDVRALLAVEEDVVAGAYTTRTPRGVVAGDPIEGGAKRGALLPMRCVGMGLTMLSRACVERMVEAHPMTAFEFRAEGGRVHGEDEVFCQKWRAMGGAVWMHTGVRVGHVGPHVYTMGAE